MPSCLPRDAFRRRARAAILVLVSLALAASASRALADDVKGVAGGPMQRTREVLQTSNRIVTGEGDRNAKLAKLKDLLRNFLDTDALARKAMGKHLDGRTPAQVKDFTSIFRDLFVRTYVQRLLLFDAPDFGFTGEKITGDTAEVNTQIITPKDEFGVDYAMKKTPGGWVATDILVEDVSLAENFRSQFDKALAKESFEQLLERLRNKLEAKPNTEF
ncbi:MAG: phospholipid-binding protein MlaC [Alphaproteobacteria bacterium]